MKWIIVPVSLAVAQLFAVNALAQSKGEVDASQAKPPAVEKATPEQKSAAKAMRKKQGSAASKDMHVTDDTQGLAKAKSTTKAQRKEAAKARKAAATSAMKKGETTSGEK